MPGIKLSNCLIAGGVLSASICSGAEISSGQSASTLFQILGFGMEINIALGVLLFIATFLVLHSYLLTRRGLVMPDDLLRQVREMAAGRNIEGAIKTAEAKDSLFSRAVVPGLKLHNHSIERISAAMEAAGRRSMSGIRQQINYIANIATICPMLGLLGTVLGLTKAFNVMGNDGSEAMRSTLMTGYIGEAMGTTAVGLIVGIPAMAAYYLCMSRLGRVGDELEAALEDIAASVAETNTVNIAVSRPETSQSTVDLWRDTPADAVVEIPATEESK